MRFGASLEMEPHASSYQVLAQVTALVGIDLCAGVIQIVILDEGAPLWGPIVICSGNYLPGQISMIVPSAGAECSMRCVDIKPGRFGIVNADSRARIGLEPSKGKSEESVPHKITSIDEARTGAAPRHNAVNMQGRICSASKAIIKEIPFECRSYHSGTEHIACLKPAEKPDIIFRIDGERNAELVGECPGAATVLKNVSSHVDCRIPTCAEELWWWRNNIFVDDGFSTLNAGAGDANRN